MLAILGGKPYDPGQRQLCHRRWQCHRRGDYTSNSGILNFAVGDTTKTVTILITDDTRIEDDTGNLHPDPV